MMRISIVFLLLFAVCFAFGQGVVWYQSTAYDFSLGLFSNVELISPDPDGMDDGAIGLVAHDTIRVLQIYPDRFDTLLVAQALETYAPLGVPPLNLRVFILPLSVFNSLTSESSYVTARDPLTLETVRLRIVDFDVLFFGIADSYGSSAGVTDLTATAAEVVRRFARHGKGVIFSHDTIWAISSASHPNFNSLSDISGLSATYAPWTVFTYVKRVSGDISNPVLNVPFILPERFEVTSCHQTGQYVVSGQTWYVGTDATGTADYGIYWHTYHNPEYDSYGAYFSYGHVTMSPREWEAKAMINSIYYSYHGGRGIGVYTSPVYDSPNTIALWRVSWSADVPSGSSLNVEIRAATAPGHWTEWQPVSAGELLSPLEGRLFQYRVQMTKAPGVGGLPILHWIRLEFITPSITARILTPPLNIITSCENQQVMIRISMDSHCHIDSSSIVFTLGGRRIELGSGLSLSGDSLLVYLPLSGWRNSDVVVFCLDSLRNSCGGVLDSSICGSFVVDLSPPVVFNERPSDRSIVAERAPIISCEIFDSLSGVDITSIRLTINDTLTFTLTEPDSYLQYIGSTLMLSPSSLGLAFGESETVRVRLDPVSDLAQLCGANSNDGLSWYFVVVIVDMWFPDTVASVGDTVLIPVFTEDLGGLNVRRFSVKVPIDTTYFKYIAVVTRGSATERWSSLTTTYLNDTLTVKGNGTTPLPSNGVLFFIKGVIPISAVPGGYTQLRLSEIELNDGELGAKGRDGILIISQALVSWMVDLNIMQDGMIFPFTLTFGAAPTGTDMFDPGLDRIYLPQPPGTPIAYFTLDDPSYPHIRYLQRDIKSSTARELLWRIRTVGSSGVIEWNVENLPQGIFKLNRLHNMRAESQYEFGSNEEIIISYTNEESVPVELIFKRGWNLISLPVIPVFALSYALGTPHIFSYDPILRQYRRANFGEEGKGYFLLSFEEQTVRLAGRNVGSYRVQLSRGWNLIGAPATEHPVSISSIRTSPPGIIISPLYWYNPTTGNYEPTTELESGKGYWLLSNQDGILIVGE